MADTYTPASALTSLFGGDLLSKGEQGDLNSSWLAKLFGKGAGTGDDDNTVKTVGDNKGQNVFQQGYQSPGTTIPQMPKARLGEGMLANKDNPIGASLLASGDPMGGGIMESLKQSLSASNNPLSKGTKVYQALKDWNTARSAAETMSQGKMPLEGGGGGLFSTEMPAGGEALFGGAATEAGAGGMAGGAASGAMGASEGLGAAASQGSSMLDLLSKVASIFW